MRRNVEALIRQHLAGACAEAVGPADAAQPGSDVQTGQRLRFHDKPLVQIVYLPEKGKPVALCVLKEAKADAAPSNGKVDGMALVSWRRGQLGYALIGESGSVDLDAPGKQFYDGQVATTVSENDTVGKVTRL
ncbi:UNVERIFIED_ORG: anti-sigma factor RsiW [Burkholderia sp. 1595]|uniref:Anti-sigma factor RsiW n=1 Tax=Paraburkholderia terricola TaxID=169427 RepID=A0ABU1LQI7_9BURK|nr:hypothetical protein [Paraburkholderia terricola]MDR6409012.1 anti-sigma factor RsiW [Paraburkholderia terricola]